MMFLVALRSLCEGSEERLFLEEPIDRFVSEIELPDTSSDFTKRYLAAFREPLPEDASKALLQDRLDTGWLVWGKKMEVTRISGWDEEAWNLDPACQPAIEVFKESISSVDWWQQVCWMYISRLSWLIRSIDRGLLGARRRSDIPLRYPHRLHPLPFSAFWQSRVRRHETYNRELSGGDGND